MQVLFDHPYNNPLWIEIFRTKISEKEGGGMCYYYTNNSGMIY